MLFSKPFFKSTKKNIEDEYTAGVLSLQKGNYSDASVHFNNAAKDGHISALYNQFILIGSGRITPYNFDLAADCWYKAAEAEHPHAKEALWQLEAADRGGFGTDNLIKIIENSPSNQGLIASIMVCAARFFDVLCRKYGATADVIAYELDAASMSEYSFIHSFIKRTGLRSDFYQGGLNRLQSGSAADQITDGLNKMSIAMIRAGYSEKIVIMARCSIVGYIILKSVYGEYSKPLLGIDTFFSS